MLPRCLQLDFHFQSKRFPCVMLQTTIFCANLVYSSAKKKVRSCTHGDLKNGIVFCVKNAGFCVTGHAVYIMILSTFHSHILFVFTKLYHCFLVKYFNSTNLLWLDRKYFVKMRPLLLSAYREPTNLGL